MDHLELPAVKPERAKFKQADASVEGSTQTIVTGSRAHRLPQTSALVVYLYAPETNSADVEIGQQSGGWIPLAAGDSMVIDCGVAVNLSNLQVNATAAAQALVILTFG